LIGVIFYIDGATTGHFVDLSVTAVKMSLSMFTFEARLKRRMWALLGYLSPIIVAEGQGQTIFQESEHLEAEDVKVLAGEGETIDVDGNISNNSEDGLTAVKTQDFHFMLSVILGLFIGNAVGFGLKKQALPEDSLQFFCLHAIKATVLCL
jgi:hypothetical protein